MLTCDGLLRRRNAWVFCWSEAIAVGSLIVVEKVKNEFGSKAAHREAIEVDGTHALYEPREAHGPDFAGESEALSIENTKIWNSNSKVSVTWLGPTRRSNFLRALIQSDRPVTDARIMKGIGQRSAIFAVLVAFWLPAAAAAGVPQSDADSYVNSTARLIAGLTPTRAEQLPLGQREAWKDHGAKMQSSWVKLRAEQAAPLMQWRDAVLPKGCPVSDTLFYPFSGPDFFNVYWLFPHCAKYVLFGLEPVGQIPAVEPMSAGQFARLLAGVREAMANLFARNYFVTSRMGKQLKREELNGVVPIFMVSMALAGMEIVSIEPLKLQPVKPRTPKANTTHDPKARAPHKLEGVTVKFRRPDSPNGQTLHYFSVDVSNKGLRDYPEFSNFIRDLGPTATLVKSASYLMHIDEFTRIRDLLLNGSYYLVQDDTGVPYSELAKRGWTVRVFGRYQKPIPPFERHFQEALAEQYEIQRPAQLRFRFGYRRAGEGLERTNVMVGVRAVPRQTSDALQRPVGKVQSR